MSTQSSRKAPFVWLLAPALACVLTPRSGAQEPVAPASAPPASAPAPPASASVTPFSKPAPAAAATSTEVRPLQECEVIARVNSEVILACEIEWQVRLLFEQKLGPGTSQQMLNSPMFIEAREGLLKSLILGRIEMALLYADFRSKAPQADMNAIKKQLETPFEETEVPRLIESTGVKDRAELETKLMSLGTSLNERRDDFFRTIIARQWLQQSVKISKEVTHEQLVEFYQSHEADYAQPERVRWEELMVRFEKYPSKSEAYAALAVLGNQAYAAAASTAAGEAAFGALAPEHSDGFTAEEGGGYDWTSQGSLASPAIEKALFETPTGQMSGIVEGPTGFHILRVIERKEAGPTPFSEVQAKIREDLYKERFDRAINEKVTELKRTARIWTKFTGDLSFEELSELNDKMRR